MKYRITVGHKAHFGRVRNNMEDSYLYQLERPAVNSLQTGSLFIVADGVGGEQGGEIASKLAVEQVARIFYGDLNEDRQSALLLAIQKANDIICAEAAQKNLERIATTIVCALILDNQLIIAHVGDSRAYRYHDGRLKQLTDDHSWINEQMRKDLISEEEAVENIQNNSIIIRWMGMNHVEPEFTQADPLSDGDLILLCTDGLYDGVSLQAMEKTLEQFSPQQACEELVDLALDSGGSDNITVLVASFKKDAGGDKSLRHEIQSNTKPESAQNAEVWLPLNTDFLTEKENKKPENISPVYNPNNMLEYSKVVNTNLFQISFKFIYDCCPKSDYSLDQQKTVQLPNGEYLTCGLSIDDETRVNGNPRKLRIWGEIDTKQIFNSSLIGYGSIEPDQLWIDWQKPGHFVLLSGDETICVYSLFPRILVRVSECAFCPQDGQMSIRANALFKRLYLNFLIQFDQEQSNKDSGAAT